MQPKAPLPDGDEDMGTLTSSFHHKQHPLYRVSASLDKTTLWGPPPQKQNTFCKIKFTGTIVLCGEAICY